MSVIILCGTCGDIERWSTEGAPHDVPLRGTRALGSDPHGAVGNHPSCTVSSEDEDRTRRRELLSGSLSLKLKLKWLALCDSHNTMWRASQDGVLGEEIGLENDASRLTISTTCGDMAKWKASVVDVLP